MYLINLQSTCYTCICFILRHFSILICAWGHHLCVYKNKKGSNPFR